MDTRASWWNIYLIITRWGVFSLNKNEIKMGLKDVTLISVLRVANPSFKHNGIDELTSEDRFFLEVKQLSYQEIN